MDGVILLFGKIAAVGSRKYDRIILYAVVYFSPSSVFH